MTAQGRHHVRDDGVLRRVRDGPEVSGVLGRWSPEVPLEAGGRYVGCPLQLGEGVVSGDTG